MKKRILAFALTLCMLISLLPVAAFKVTAAENWKEWKQTDSRWGSIALGNSSCTMSGYGCLVTSMAKIMVQSGIVSSDYFNPGTLVTWLNNNNTESNPSFTSGGALYWAKPTQMISGFKLVDYTYGTNNGLTGSSTNCESKLMELVKANYHIILAVNNFGHYIAVDNAKSLETGRIYIMDTLSNSQNVDVLLTSRYSAISNVALYSGWTDEALDNIVEYVGKCTAYDSYCKIKITSKASLMSQPCSSGTDSSSTYIESVASGIELTATGLYMNTAGNLWYKVTAPESGETAYVPSSHTSFVSMITSDMKISGVSAPTTLTQGTAFSIKGTISTTYNTLSEVSAYVYTGTNTTGTASTGKAVSTSGKSYLLYNSTVDAGVKFNDLAAGNYNYVVRATAKTNYAKSEKEVASTSSSKILHQSTFTVTTTSCSHSYSSKVTTAATCATNGVRTYTCSSCGASYTETIAATGNHSYTSKITTAATCTDNGVRTYTCSNCSASYTESIAATGHSYGSWETTQAAGCNTAGEQKRTCSACGDVQTQTIDAVGHDYISVHVNATCKEYGYTEYVCMLCEDYFVEYDAASYSEWSTTKPDGVDESLIESRTEYRYQTKEYTTSDSSSLSGWTLYDTTSQWGDYGSWSNWSTTNATASDTTKVESRTVYGYYYYLCPSCGAHMHGYGSCYTWAGGCGAATNNSGWHEVWSTTSWDNAGLKDWYGTGKYYTYIDGELVFKWPESSAKTQYRYCTRELEYTYHFYKWSDWSDWSATAVTESEDQNVETRTVYRCAELTLGDHRYKSVVTAPTCTAQGYTTYTCSVCGGSYKDNYVKATGHTEVTDAAVAATCTTAGKTEGKHCSVCNTVTVAQTTVAAKGHSWGEWTTSKAATETTVGEKIRTCAACGATETQEIPALGHTHSYKDTVTKPTCTAQGYTTYTCACGDSYKDSYVNATGHTEVTDAAVAATCTTAGKTEGKHCSVCNAVTVAQTTVVAKGHSWGEWTTSKAATETTVGEKIRTCAACGAAETQVIPALGHTHSYKDTVTKPTCTAQGYTTHTCACGESYKDNYTNATGHSWSDWAVIKDATETAKGEKVRTCATCGTTETQEIPALGHTHSYKDTVTKPTCTEKGYTTHTCACGDSYVDSYTNPTGHSYSGGKCTVCGTADPNYTAPSVNPFVDVKETDYFYAPVLWAAENGVTTGTSATTFSPEWDCTRGQVVTFIWRSAGEPEPTITENPFADVKETDYFYKAVLWAVEKGITTGYSATEFGPEDTCTRGQVVTFLWRYAGKPAASVSNPFEDVNDSQYYYGSILWAVEMGITTGYTPTTFGPDDNCTRGQIVTFLYRALK